MIDLLHNLALGFSVSLSPMNLFPVPHRGAGRHRLIGVLPGVGPLATIAHAAADHLGLPPVGR